MEINYIAHRWIIIFVSFYNALLWLSKMIMYSLSARKYWLADIPCNLITDKTRLYRWLTDKSYRVLEILGKNLQHISFLIFIKTLTLKLLINCYRSSGTIAPIHLMALILKCAAPFGCDHVFRYQIIAFEPLHCVAIRKLISNKTMEWFDTWLLLPNVECVLVAVSVHPGDKSLEIEYKIQISRRFNHFHLEQWRSKFDF